MEQRSVRKFASALDAKETLHIYELESTARVMLKPAGYTIRFPSENGPAGDHGTVAFTDKHWKMFQNQVQDEARAQLEVAMKAWCRCGPRDLPPKKFKFENQYQKDGKNTRIEAFKGWQVRFFGTTVDVDGKPMFLVTGADLSKKKTRGDQDILKAAGKAAHDLVHSKS